MTANASSSSAANRADVLTDPGAGIDRLRVELQGSGLLPPLPDAFLAGRDRDLLAPLAFLPPGRPPAAERPTAAPDRTALAAALAAANTAYGHPGADELAAKLADPATRVVVAGQQPGFLGGPLYTLSKAVAAARWAAALEEAGHPAVALFWVATEDHDFHEVATAVVPTHDGPLEVDLGEDTAPLVPVGMRTLGPRVTEALDAVRASQHGDRYDRWLDQVSAWYRPDARFGEAFCRLMAALLGERCPLLLDAMLPAVKAAQRPWLERLVERRDDVEAAYAGADGLVEERGYPLQVHPQRGVSPLFLFTGGHGSGEGGGERRRIAWSDGERYELRGVEAAPQPLARLREIIRDNPTAVSPGVLARPVVQDAILGTTLMVLGPGETSYMPQVAPLYDVLEVEAPQVALRPQTLVLESHQVDKLEEAELTLAELLSPRERLDRVLAERAGDDVTAEPRQRIEAILDELEEPALALDPNLERPLEKTREHVLRSLDAFAGKARSAAARRDEVRAGRVDKLRQSVLPFDKLQERVVCSAHYRGKYAERFAEAYWQQMELDGSVLQVVTP